MVKKIYSEKALDIKEEISSLHDMGVRIEELEYLIDLKLKTLESS